MLGLTLARRVERGDIDCLITSRAEQLADPSQPTVTSLEVVTPSTPPFHPPFTPSTLPLSLSLSRSACRESIRTRRRL